MRTSKRFLPALFLCTLIVPQIAAASHFRSGRVWWCGNPQPSGEQEIQFFVEVAINGDDPIAIGAPVLVELDFGDGARENVLLHVSEVHATDWGNWYVAGGEVAHVYAPGALPTEAGIETCCRLSGFEPFTQTDLNNRRFEFFHVKTLVAPGTSLCTQAEWPASIVWLAGGLGDAFEIPIHLSDHDPIGCRFATDAEAGGGSNPSGMTIDPETCDIQWTPTSGDPEKLWTTQVRIERLDGWGGQAFASGALDFLIGLDAAGPACRVARVVPGPPTRLEIFVQDPRSGLGAIQVLQAANASVAIPPFGPGSAEPFTVVATKIDPSRTARVELRVTDTVGNVTLCDPILTEEIRTAGRPQSRTWTDVPPEERFVTVINGDPGLRMLEIEVNGRIFRLTGLRPGEERTIDVGSAVIEGRASTFTLTSHGRPGGSAIVMIWG